MPLLAIGQDVRLRTCLIMLATSPVRAWLQRRVDCSFGTERCESGRPGELARRTGVRLEKEWRLQSLAGAIGRWLGVFAIAMLFIGPPIGQWRAAQEPRADRSGWPERAGQSANAHDHGSAAHAVVNVQGSHGTQVGVLVLDHCGYCQLVACFAALPGSWAALPLFDWSPARAAPPSYQAPLAPFVSTWRARAPPPFHS